MHPPGVRPNDHGALILDYGSQYTLLIARRLREIGIYAEIFAGDLEEPPQNFRPSCIILSGGPDSVGEHTARKLPPWVLESELAVLGICYGMQLLVEAFPGGSVRSGKQREYGRSQISLSSGAKFEGPASVVAKCLAEQKDRVVWMSHGDDLSNLPSDFSTLATTSDGVSAVIAHNSKPIIGLQFHPEVEHTAMGRNLFRSFVAQLADANLDWQAKDMVTGTQAAIQNSVGDGTVLMAVSGGVDSTVASVLMSRALGPEKVTAVFVDHGLLRKNEAEDVQKCLKDLGLNNLVTLNCKDKFFTALAGKTDPEEKRKIIGRLFIEEFESFAKAHKGEFTHLGQGTLYPDVIESAGHGAGAKVIKSHHNVGGLPEKLALDLVEPFRFCFKDEVRRIGRELKISETIIGRHPFPGPGLAVRIPGEVTSEKVAMLQEADHIYITALKEQGLYDKIWQAFAVLLPVRSVGVMGDNRTYQWTCSLRAVTGTDAMTASAADLPISFLSTVADRIVRRVDGINRVLYDVTSKPPATIEWE